MTQIREKGRFAGEVATKLGVGVQTLHFYEREGLIPAPPRSAAGYRLYTPEIIGRVGFIRKAQALGLALEEIREVLTLAERGGCPCGRVRDALTSKLDEVDARLRELRSFRRDLAALVARSEEFSAQTAGASICSIVEHAVALQSVAREGSPLARRNKARGDGFA